MNRVSDSMVI